MTSASITSSTAKSILVVDDDPVVMEVIVQILQNAGYETASASNGNEALVAMETKTFDLIISDILMPQKTGLELIPAILAKYPRTRIIAMSGAGIQVVKSLYLTMAAAAFSTLTFLDKPFQMVQLLDLVTEVLTSPPP